MIKPSGINKISIGNILIFISGALTLTFKSGYIAGTILMLPLIIFDAYKNIKKPLNKEQKIILITYLTYFISQFIFIIHDTEYKLSEFELPSRCLLGILIFLFISRNKISFHYISNGIATGAIIGGAIAIYEKVFLGWGRAFDNIMPIQAGDTCMSLGLMSLCLSFYHIKKNNKKYFIFFIAAALSGITGSLLSGSRGGWILLPVNIFIIISMNRDLISGRIIGALLLLITILISVCSIPSLGVYSRVNLAVQDLHRFTDKQWAGNDGTNSLGIRLMLWKSNWNSFKEKPLLGWGNFGISKSYNYQYEKGDIPLFIRDYGINTHAHNQFLDEMAKKGLFGLASLLSIFLIPATMLHKKEKDKESREIKHISQSGLLLIFSTIDYFISQAFFNHSSGISFYFITISILLGFSLRIINTKYD
ncbi:O-antigen ligase family protein [Tatumella sp. UBA2305]|uniref:O-antigen ligase family protein n=1 Tax=Tatumella sp. UBA2305 TaxID=1947647 RepID=UPI0025F6BFE9|nr:O-antigen ligase family protein [Tatumella sp. UBA2305]